MFEETVVDGQLDGYLFFGLRDSYYEIIRGALRRNDITKEEILATVVRPPKIEYDDVMAYAAATAKYYLHKFGIEDKDMPSWIDETPSCDYLTPFVMNAEHLLKALATCPPEFREKNVLVAAQDFAII